MVKRSSQRRSARLSTGVLLAASTTIALTAWSQAQGTPVVPGTTTTSDLTTSSGTTISSDATTDVTAADVTPAPDQAPRIALATGSTGWSYLQVGHGAAYPHFAEPGYDASGWPVGKAGFGSESGCAFDPGQMSTHWDTDTDLLLRHTLDIPAGATSAHISGTVDDFADIYLNGTLLKHVESGHCHRGEISLDVPAADLHPGNLLALRARDVGGSAFVDVQVTYQAPPVTPLVAGTFTGFTPSAGVVRPKKAGRLHATCTTGFAVSAGAGTYSVTPDNCREWTRANGTGLSLFASPVDVLSSSDPHTQVVWAARLNCTTNGPRCLRPNDAHRSGDLLAWQPDPGTVTPVGQVLTAHGVQPVIGAQAWSKHLVVCRAGAATGAERCGRVGGFNTTKHLAWSTDDDGAVALPGDDGAPVYTYVKDSTGRVTGVKAVGVTVSASRTRTYFYPIADLEAALNATLVTSSVS